MQSKYIKAKVVFGLVCVALVIEVIRDLSFTGDFIGYVNAGNLALDGKNIYSDVLNTWPPFFSIFSIPLSWVDAISPVFNRLVWLLLSLLAFYHSMDIAAKLLLQKRIAWRDAAHTIAVFHPAVLVPLLLIMRLLLDNLANIQINIFLFWGCIYCIFLYTKQRDTVAGAMLALLISLKVYPIFLWFFFIYKKSWKLAITTAVCILLIAAASILYFGWDVGLAYYHTWLVEVTPRSYIAHYKNQSIMGAMLRLLTEMDTGMQQHINLCSLPPQWVQRITYCIVAALALVPMLLFRRGDPKPPILSLIEFAFVLGAIPLLSPLAWKAYFIFLWLAFFVAYYLLFLDTRRKLFINLHWPKVLFAISILLTTFSSELFLGKHLAHWAEMFAVVTIGTVLLLVVLLILYINIKKKGVAFATKGSECRS